MVEEHYLFFLLLVGIILCSRFDFSVQDLTFSAKFFLKKVRKIYVKIEAILVHIVRNQYLTFY